jgi:hypothetical protein
MLSEGKKCSFSLSYETGFGVPVTPEVLMAFATIEKEENDVFADSILNPGKTERAPILNSNIINAANKFSLFT